MDKFKYTDIDHVQLAAPIGAEEKARAFYQAILGFQEIEKPPLLRRNGGVWFKAGNVEIHVGVEPSFTPAKKAHPAIQVKRLDALMEHLKESEIEITVDNKIPSVNRFYVMDPFGNRLEFLER
ncbi:glyoxalase [Oceanobacillus piezotolerans]|uniref:Glyoxalase n=1 Tax=Oceanobacillus piezotolerans TaxID=2448030 RepID=A0A498DP49_9BACI|nr:VOC family protein [Oceanobacillus piezotolerans]RLL45502.1 glyoxalase [Oceanobacillus piezotolerans]